SSAGLAVEYAIHDDHGQALTELAPRLPLRLTLQYRDPATELPAAGLRPVVWLRKSRPGIPVCTEAVRAFRATARLSRDDVPLVGTVLAALDARGQITLAEPEVGLNAANLLAVIPTGDGGAIMLPRPQRGDILVFRPGLRDVVRIRPPQSAPLPLAHEVGHADRMVLAERGRFWLIDQAAGRASLFDDDGRRLAEHAWPSPIRVHEAGHSAGDLQLLVQVVSGGVLSWLNRQTGERRDTAADVPALMATTRDYLIHAGTDREIILRPRDTPESILAWQVRFTVAGLRLDPSQRLALIWSQSGDLAILDLAREGRIRAVFRGEGPVGAVHFGEEAVYVGWADRPIVSVISLALLGSGDAAIRAVRLAASAEQTDAAPGGVVGLVPVDRMPAVLARTEGSSRMETVMAGGGLAQSAGAILTLRVAPPKDVQMLPRAPRETEPGRFEAHFMLPRGGSWELITATGLSGTTRCFTLTAGREEEQLEAAAIMIAAADQPRPGQSVQLVVTLPTETRPIARVTVAGLEGQTGAVSVALRREDGRYDITARFDRPGVYALAMPGRTDIEPAMIEVAP
ncbi:MAG: hypothetical protein LW892_01785, partial [Betaproteobacteria bacterium]|nr:hypothetical protein [Betaproteobacteria bacterium]